MGHAEVKYLKELFIYSELGSCIIRIVMYSVLCTLCYKSRNVRRPGFEGFYKTKCSLNKERNTRILLRLHTARLHPPSPPPPTCSVTVRFFSPASLGWKIHVSILNPPSRGWADHRPCSQLLAELISELLYHCITGAATRGSVLYLLLLCVMCCNL